MKLLVGSVSGKVLLLHEDEAQWPEDPNPILLSRVAALSFTGITSVTWLQEKQLKIIILLLCC